MRWGTSSILVESNKTLSEVFTLAFYHRFRPTNSYRGHQSSFGQRHWLSLVLYRRVALVPVTFSSLSSLEGQQRCMQPCSYISMTKTNRNKMVFFAVLISCNLTILRGNKDH